MKKSILTLFLVIVMSVYAVAEVKVQARLRSSEVPLNGTVIYDLIISAEGGIDQIHMPQFEPNFEVISKGTSQSFSVVNGVVNRSQGLSISLAPQKEGSFKIGKAQVVVGGKTYESEEVVVKVVGPVKQAQQNPFGFAPQGWIRGMMQQQESRQNMGAPVFAKISVSKPEVYVGEEFRYTLEFYYRVNVLSNVAYQIPEIIGASVEVLKGSEKPVETQVKGVPYLKHTLIGGSVFPMKAGKLTLNPVKISLVINPMEGQKDIQSEPITVQVKPLPDSGKPDSFRGTVGSFSMSQKIDKKEGEVGEPLTVEFIVSGQGNIKSITKLDVKESKAFKWYQSNTAQTLSKTPVMGGIKRLEYILIPQKEGQLELPQFEYSYFDLKEKQYKTLKSTPITLNIKKGKGNKLKLEEESNSGRDSENQGSIVNIQKMKDRLIISLISILALGIVWLNREKIKMFKKVSRKKIIDKELSALEKYNKDDLCAKIENTLWDVLEYHCKTTLRVIEVDQLPKKLIENNINENIAEQIVALLKGVHKVGYSPEKGSVELQERYKKQAIEIIKLIKKSKK